MRKAVKEIRDENELYAAMSEYIEKSWHWGIDCYEDGVNEPAPQQLIEILNKRIEWVKAHSAAVEKYLRRRNGPTWYYVIDGTLKDED
jgi:hypothetical protein